MNSRLSVKSRNMINIMQEALYHYRFLRKRGLPRQRAFKTAIATERLTRAYDADGRVCWTVMTKSQE